MSVKLIALDLDGTLLTKKNTVEEIDIQALSKAHENGVEIAICTGRVYGESAFAAEALKVCRYVIACNGGHIYDRKLQKNIRKVKIPDTLAMQIGQKIEQYPVFYQAFTDRYAACDARLYPLMKTSGINEAYVHQFYEKQVVQKNMLHALISGHVDILKFFISSTDLDSLAAIRTWASQIPGVALSASLPTNVEIIPYGMDKFESLQFLGKYLGISTSDMMAIGDSENDINMVKYSGIGIAMGNATDEIKQAAAFITDTNENGGIAKAVKKFVLQTQEVLV